MVTTRAPRLFALLGLAVLILAPLTAAMPAAEAEDRAFRHDPVALPRDLGADL